MAYPFVASRYRRGSRSGPTLGILFHHAEGGNTVQYLANDPLRGVSCHFVIEYTGRIVQMLQWDEMAGTLNPRDRSTDKPYYGHSHLVDVLGEWWVNPNNALIQVEMEGFARTGPNANQREAAVRLTADAVRRFPSLRGALGHADQTDTKACPGRTDAMKALFASIGGHGLWTEEEVPARSFTFDLSARSGIATVSGYGHTYVRLATAENLPIPAGSLKRSFGPVTLVDQEGKPVGPGGPDDPRTKGYIINDEAAFMIEADVQFTPDPTPEGQRERDRSAVLAAVEEVFAEA